MDREPADGEDDYDDEHHLDDALLVADALGGGAASRSLVPQAV